MKKVLLLVLALAAWSQEKPKTPKDIKTEQRLEVTNLRIGAYKVLVQRIEAERREQEASKNVATAKLDQATAQKSLDESNLKIDKKVQELRTLSGADETWDLNDAFEWVQKTGGSKK